MDRNTTEMKAAQKPEASKKTGRQGGKLLDAAADGRQDVALGLPAQRDEIAMQAATELTALAPATEPSPGVTP